MHFSIPHKLLDFECETLFQDTAFTIVTQDSYQKLHIFKKKIKAKTPY